MLPGTVKYLDIIMGKFFYESPMIYGEFVYDIMKLGKIYEENGLAH